MTNRFIRYAIAALVVGIGAIAVASPASAALGDAQKSTPIGIWIFQNNRFAIEIDPCGDRLCGKITWLKAPNDARGLPRVDSENADTSLRTRSVLGLTILSGLRRTDARNWQDGNIYNPDDGGHYQASMSMNDDGTLRVRAYLGVPMVGKTLRLTRMS